MPTTISTTPVSRANRLAGWNGSRAPRSTDVPDRDEEERDEEMAEVGDSPSRSRGLRGTPARSSPPAKAPMIMAEPHRSASQAIREGEHHAKTVVVPGSSIRSRQAKQVRDEPSPHDGRHHEEADRTAGRWRATIVAETSLPSEQSLDDRQDQEAQDVVDHAPHPG